MCCCCCCWDSMGWRNGVKGEGVGKGFVVPVVVVVEAAVVALESSLCC